MNEPEPVTREATAAPAAEPAANGSNGPPAADEPPLAVVAPPTAVPVIASPPPNQPLMVSPPPCEPVIVSAPPSEPVVETAAVSVFSPIMPDPAPHKSPEVEALEDRLRRLEAALTTLADTQQMEERLAERISKRAEQAAPMARPAAAPVATPAPEATPVLEPTTAIKPVDAEPGRRWLPFLRGGPSPSTGPADGVRARLRSSWLLLDIFRDFQSILHMYGDPRYRLTWSGRILPVVFLAAILTSYYWSFPLLWWMPDVLHSIILKLIDLVPAFCMYKVLTREAQRYRETIPQYPTHG